MDHMGHMGHMSMVRAAAAPKAQARHQAPPALAPWHQAPPAVLALSQARPAASYQLWLCLAASPPALVGGLQGGMRDLNAKLAAGHWMSHSSFQTSFGRY
eukprot:CAMPEP_0202910366 /NCGR_PEP_ID=MMETSP1392-20130828/51857_1 /ASSEMBLY_ACC=CAM_ASM_000868 /TAXON_ID=225041 /ORGANISM="Chlamydomonas chlamydogama, Strain SAG 11-48b" /LENGTH=99 /DNA_ID=CAMNT_0049600461 /DNA_START=48 /DNA_END=348 /DNA_ORIENTATION=-